MRGEAVRPVVIAAGGTGGHLFPAEALAVELAQRGHRIALMTDARSGAHSAPAFHGRDIYVLKGSGIAGRGVGRAAAGALALAAGTMQARAILGGLDAAVIIGFGGYPSVPPVLGSRLLARRPAVILHEQNAVLGRANRLLARFATRLALGMGSTLRLPGTPASVVTGNPVRPAIAALHGLPYAPPESGGPVHLLVTGGSQGARVFSQAMPAAVALLPPALRARLRLVQQCRPEDIEQVRQDYAALGVAAELSPFFPDIADRLAAAHLVVGRAGAGTVSELAVAGRPALLVPLPGAIDQHQLHNAQAVDAAVIEQPVFERAPQALADALSRAIASPEALAAQAAAMARRGIQDAASRLADLVEQTVAQGIRA